MVGGIPENFGVNFKLGNGRLMVLEGDEYDTAFFDKRPKFVHYNPHSVILTGIEFDHADIYRDEEHVLSAFAMLYPLIPPDGYLLLCSDYPHLINTIGDRPYLMEGYGINTKSSWLAKKIDTTTTGMTFRVSHDGQEITTLASPLAGDHNLQNIVACIAMARYLDVPWKPIQQALLSFKGVKKRQELIAHIRDVRVMVDFAHHPTAVRETIKGLKSKYQNNRIIAVFEPKTQTSRRNLFQKQYTHALAYADLVLIAPVCNPYGLPQSELLSTHTIATDLKKQNKICFNTNNYDEIVNVLLDVLEPGDLVVFMSSGDFEGIPSRFVDVLRARDKV
jgi:UDP-N-acetylmuramate: L-alanyl-gamma-D-glutamyl-meso-diaminopimelate ligase